MIHNMRFQEHIRSLTHERSEEDCGEYVSGIDDQHFCHTHSPILTPYKNKGDTKWV